jgi:hypothetical protein
MEAFLANVSSEIQRGEKHTHNLEPELDPAEEITPQTNKQTKEIHKPPSSLSTKSTTPLPYPSANMADKKETEEIGKNEPRTILRRGGGSGMF